MRKKIVVLILLALVFIGISILTFGKKEPVDFSAEVKPILNKHCITCHGGVKKNGVLSFLFENEAFARAESGKPVVPTVKSLGWLQC
ncbi:MAG: hypothetical protein LBJ04_13215 [Sphingobacterium sp.]|jgi:hypothetical protein|nr:hypothetical protein [Sphingobacterium sp.]